MADPIFDGANKTITLGAGVVAVDVQRDLYSAWKRWVTDGDGSQYDVAFDNAFGGNEVGTGLYVSGYFILRNDLGWRIVPDSANHELTVTGNLYAAAPATAMFNTPATYTIPIYLERSINAQLVSTGGSIPTASENAIAVWAEAVRGTDTAGDTLVLIERLLRNKLVTDPTTGVMTLYDDAGGILLQGNLYEGTGTSQAYRGQGAERRERLT